MGSIRDADALIDRVQRALPGHSRHEARQATAYVVQGLAKVLPARLRQELFYALPEGTVTPGSPPDAKAPEEWMDRQGFIGPLVQSFDTASGEDASLGGLDLNSTYRDDDASTRIRAVCSVLRSILPERTVGEISKHLPPEIADWWGNA